MKVETGERRITEPRPQGSGRYRRQSSSATNRAICSPCSSITYRRAFLTSSSFHSQRVLPCRAQRFRPRPSLPSRFSSRLAYALNSFMILSGRVSASTMTGTWLDLTCAARRFQRRCAQCLWMAARQLPGPPGRAHAGPEALPGVLPSPVVNRAPTIGCPPDCDSDPRIRLRRRAGVRRSRRT